jgi:hypothetical protein
MKRYVKKTKERPRWCLIFLDGAQIHEINTNNVNYPVTLNIMFYINMFDVMHHSNATNNAK